MSLIDRALSIAETVEKAGKELDRVLASVAPGIALRRRRDRHMLDAYEATRPGRTRRMGLESRGPDVVNIESAESLKSQARYLDENYDLVTGALDTLVMRVVGPRGIMVEPMVKATDGSLHKEFNRQLNDLFIEFYKRPDVTGEYSGAMCEQLACRTWLRDGEEFTQLVQGPKPGLVYPTGIPFAIELLEPDLVPHVDFGVNAAKVHQGVEKNAWGRPLAYHVYREHPGEFMHRLPTQSDLKRVSSDNIIHLKMIKRIGQTRGVTLLHSVITRIEDLKDYEESERIAARIAAAAAFYIKKGSPDTFTPPQDADSDRSFKIAPGIVFDRLQQGEEVGSIQSNRPSALLEPFRNAMVKMLAAGMRISYSSTAKDYNGTYSAQRQELVEQWDMYATMQNWFADSFKRPIYEAFIRVAVLSGRLVIPDDVDLSTLYRAHYQGPAMPWIDPDKEGKANERNVRAGFTSRSQVVRSRNHNPIELDEQLTMERERERESGLVLTSNAIHDLTEAPPPEDENKDQTEEAE